MKYLSEIVILFGMLTVIGFACLYTAIQPDEVKSEWVHKMSDYLKP